MDASRRSNRAASFISSKIDAAKAALYFRRAADRGDATGLYNLAVCLHAGRGVARDDAEAARLARAAAELGHAKAAFNVGVAYLRGLGVARDPWEADRWLASAATAGHQAAKDELEKLRLRVTGRTSPPGHLYSRLG